MIPLIAWHCKLGTFVGRTAMARAWHRSRQNSGQTLSTLSFEKVGVVGLGLMGHGIAQVTAQAAAASLSPSAKVIAYEAQDKFLDSGRARIEKSLATLVKKGKMSSDDATAVTDRITYTTDITLLADTDLIVEAVIENMDLKRDLYTKLGDLCQPSTVFASNTSSLSITAMSQFSGRLDRFIGIHFFNPVQLMKLVEVIRTEQTDPAVVQRTIQWVKDIGKVPVSCGDTPGFIVNRLLVPALMQAMLLAEKGHATVADIDTSMQLGAGHPMGPLHLADYIGLDTCLYIVEGWVADYPNEPAFFVPGNLKALVAAGHCGRKSGRGFYYWDGDKRGDPVM
jgi:3-hydroxyacyl-CoA dehydrogenase